MIVFCGDSFCQPDEYPWNWMHQVSKKYKDSYVSLGKDAVSNFGFSNILGTCEKSILVNGGYIIKINPIANGTLVVPEENELMKSAEFGIK